MSVRAFFLLLIMANLVFFIWSQGYFGDTSTGREPQRMAEQLRPESIRLMQPLQGTAEAVRCQRIGGLAASAAQFAKATWETDGAWNASQESDPPAKEYWVLIPGLVTEVLAEKKRSELALFGISDAKVFADEGNGPYVVSLASSPDEAAAKRYYDSLAGKGVRSARMILREREPAVTLMLSGPAADFEQHLKALALPASVLVVACEVSGGVNKEIAR